ncbi:MAG: purine-nucleoside phosphorylase [Kiritimatiellae bacterium]|nr:purine-nucleoside phosphorylase [Kiritimatiellia bacterium]
MDYQELDNALQAVRKRWPEARPACGLILGSGWSDVAEAFTIRDTMPYTDIPGLGATGVVGHAGRLALAEYAGKETLIFQGRRHWYEGVGWTPIAIPVYLLKQLGASMLLVTNAAGGIREDLPPGTLMALDDHINFLGSHPLIGAHDPVWGPRFPDQTFIYKPELRAAMDRAAKAAEVPLKHGVYLAASGPTYETPAEIQFYKRIGADAVGMSTVPEALLANAAGLRVAGLSCITNFAAGILAQPLSHEEVTEATKEAMPRMKSFVLKFWEEITL